MISILMPIYNGIEFIEESVNSILIQTYENWQLIIGINGHSENSDVFNIAKKYELKNNKIIVLDLYNIKGKSNALNEMIKYCKYNYVALLDVDDIWDSKKLEIQSCFLNNYDVIGSKCVYFGYKYNGFIPNIQVYDISNYDFYIRNPIINSSVIIKKDLCFWKENSIEDYDLWLNLRRHKKKFYNCPEVLVKHRVHQESAFNAKGNHLLVNDLISYHKNLDKNSKCLL